MGHSQLCGEREENMGNPAKLEYWSQTAGRGPIFLFLLQAVLHVRALAQLEAYGIHSSKLDSV